jgi:hypothetical protein
MPDFNGADHRIPTQYHQMLPRVNPTGDYILGYSGPLEVRTGAHHVGRAPEELSAYRVGSFSVTSGQDRCRHIIVMMR